MQRHNLNPGNGWITIRERHIFCFVFGNQICYLSRSVFVNLRKYNRIVSARNTFARWHESESCHPRVFFCLFVWVFFLRNIVRLFFLLYYDWYHGHRQGKSCGAGAKTPRETGLSCSSLQLNCRTPRTAQRDTLCYNPVL